MRTMSWKVHVPTGRWMAGVQSFSTKAKALAFTDRWNQVEVNGGQTSVCWYRDGQSFKALAS